ncbi:Pleckstrin-likey domain-containing family M member 2, partial [Ophiophagus hannah]
MCSSLQLQSYFAACEDETPAIRNHDTVLQRLCRAWLYLALNENSLESYLRIFQENLPLLHKHYVKNALVCSHDHLTLFLTLVAGLEFIRFDLDLDAPYLDLAPYMPDYYKPQYLLDFEDRLPSSVHGSDSLSLNSFNSVTSTNLEWDDSAIAPSSEGKGPGRGGVGRRHRMAWERPDSTECRLGLGVLIRLPVGKAKGTEGLDGTEGQFFIGWRSAPSSLKLPPAASPVQSPSGNLGAGLWVLSSPPSPQRDF